MERVDPGGTMTDVSWFNATPSNSSQVASNHTAAGVMDGRPDLAPAQAQPHAPRLRVPFQKYSKDYDMTGEKILIIFNHYKYQRSEYFGDEVPSKRYGTFNDVANLETTFGRLGFRPLVFTDQTHSQILDVMSQVCSKDHKYTSCIAVVIMSHGEYDEVFAADRRYSLNDIISPLQNGHPSLVGKPKLVFVQACRSGHMDSGRPVRTTDVILPTHADTLIMRSSSQHYFSYREAGTGSWLIKSLCKEVRKYHDSYDLVSLLTFVNQDVANESTSTPGNPYTANKKQMPVVKHSLTKFVRL